MCAIQPMIDLGFSKDTVPAGTHICLVYSSEEERRDTLQKFVLAGLQNGERTACYSNHVSAEELRQYFDKHNISIDAQFAAEMFTLAGTDDVYFSGGKFDPERLLDTISAYYQETVERDIPASRIIGEMTPKVKTVPGGDRLTEYEARITKLLRTHPVTSVCQYNANEFEAGTLMEVLKVHPQMLVNGMVVHNPFFIPPETFLQEN